MKLTITNDELQGLNGTERYTSPKYTSQLINLANQNAQGTRQRVVGQLSNLFPEYQTSSDNITVGNWEQWYIARYPDAIENATEKIFAQVENLKKAIQLIDKDMVMQWVKDLVITKTFNGLYLQKAILAKLAALNGQQYRLAYPSEEAKGIDGFVGNKPYSIKPDTYKTMDRLPETIEVNMIYYKKTKTGIKLEIED